MTLRKWTVAVSFVLLMSSLAAFELIPWSVGICEEDTVAESRSPDGKYLARSYIRNCGATTGYLMHVNLRGSWDYFNPTWVGTIKQGQIASKSCLNETSLIWKDSTHLEIQFDKCDYPVAPDRIHLTKVERWNDVEISYLDYDQQSP